MFGVIRSFIRIILVLIIVLQAPCDKLRRSRWLQWIRDRVAWPDEMQCFSAERWLFLADSSRENFCCQSCKPTCTDLNPVETLCCWFFPQNRMTEIGSALDLDFSCRCALKNCCWTGIQIAGSISFRLAGHSATPKWTMRY